MHIARAGMECSHLLALKLGQNGSGISLTSFKSFGMGNITCWHQKEIDQMFKEWDPVRVR
jgi:hypothetical protein